jgi:hypothetical protein
LISHYWVYKQKNILLDFSKIELEEDLLYIKNNWNNYLLKNKGNHDVCEKINFDIQAINYFINNFLYE